MTKEPRLFSKQDIHSSMILSSAPSLSNLFKISLTSPQILFRLFWPSISDTTANMVRYHFSKPPDGFSWGQVLSKAASPAISIELATRSLPRTFCHHWLRSFLTVKSRGKAPKETIPDNLMAVRSSLCRAEYSIHET
jgi:hypothetical protein